MRHPPTGNISAQDSALSVTMTKKLLFLMTILLVASFALMAADVSGKWTFEQPGRGGNPGRPVTITLKADGSTLTGTMPAGGRGGGGDPIAISDGKIDGNNVTFTVKREMNGNTIVTKYEGVLNGDELKLKITRPGQDGTPVVVDVVAKRSAT
ncbi:MAG: hypothetical protein JWP63_2520 [Candidatus Solibacter sp.]|jgi:hypothetical protein|nr:hypothetical protein [Candidatus Solibacter sp.]